MAIQPLATAPAAIYSVRAHPSGTFVFAAWARKLAARAEAAAVRKRQSAWRRYAKEMIGEKGGDVAFRWIKQTLPWAQPRALLDPISGIRRLEKHPGAG